MTGSSGERTNFHHVNNLSFGFEEVASQQDLKSKEAFGRNTLYNPKHKSDLLSHFPAGDALATSAAAANLIRPIHKPESRRGSSNSQIGTMKRTLGERMRSNSRLERQSENSQNSLERPSTDKDRYTLQAHNRRTDFPSRKAAGGRSAMS
jgi:hypothetical protein